MLRMAASSLAFVTLVIGACGESEYAVRSIPRIAADTVGKPVKRLQEAFGPTRKIDTTPTKLVYVWFLPESVPGAPRGFNGCELEVTVDRLSEHVLGYSAGNIGWGRCTELERKIRVAED